MRPRSISLLLLLFTAFTIVSAQTSAQSPARSLAAAERSLAEHLGRIDSLSQLYGPGEPADLSDSIEQENDRFGDSLQVLTSEDPSSITYKFSRLVSLGLTIATSPDGLLRIYSWDAETGGTAHSFNKVYQYKIGHKTYSRFASDDDGWGWFSAIYQLARGNRTYYLGVSHSKVATLRGYESINVFRVEGENLNDTAHIIKTASGLTGSLGFDFVMDEAWSGKDQIHYDPATKTIRFPVVLEEGHITKRRITYAFNGKYFVLRRP